MTRRFADVDIDIIIAIRPAVPRSPSLKNYYYLLRVYQLRIKMALTNLWTDCRAILTSP